MKFLDSVLRRKPQEAEPQKDLVALSDKYYSDDGTKKPNHYLGVYAAVLSPIRHMSFDLLELGVSSGASLLAWRDFFPNANIVGLDIRDMPAAISNQVEAGTLHFVRGIKAALRYWTDVFLCRSQGDSMSS